MSVLLTILWALLWLVLGLLGLVLFLLCWPVGARLHAERYDATRALVHVRYALGLLSARLRVDAEAQQVELRILGVRIWRRNMLELIFGREPKKPEELKKPRKPKPEGEAERGSWPGLPPHLGWVAQRTARALCLRGELVGVYGFEDPGTTGMVEGLRAAVSAAVPALTLHDLRPDYTDAVLYGHARVSLQVWVPRLAVATVGFFLDRRGREFVRHFRKKSKAVVGEQPVAAT